ncbi:MAG TPA: hypothetical protein VFN16_07225 [Saccharospirillum sp.]|nr:hypothetical protein [Saccharospirillum sp.]
MTKAASAPEPYVHNPVAKFNPHRGQTFTDRKKSAKRGYQKHRPNWA